MDVSDLIARTENSTGIDACIKLPPNQDNNNTSSWHLLGKLIIYKLVGLSIVSDLVNRVWRPVFKIQVSWLENNVFMFNFQHEVDMANAFRRRP